jgi:hypothetical protein
MKPPSLVPWLRVAFLRYTWVLGLICVISGLLISVLVLYRLLLVEPAPPVAVVERPVTATSATITALVEWMDARRRGLETPFAGRPGRYFVEPVAVP